MTENLSDTGEGDELVPLARIVEELDWPIHRVRQAMKEVRDRLRMVRSGTGKHYPLTYTVALLREHLSGVPSSTPDVKDEEWITLEVLAVELGWSSTTVRKALTKVRPLLRPLVSSKDARKKAYPRRHTLALLRREHGRVQARRERSLDAAGGYWTALASLKVASSRLRQLVSDSGAIERETRKAFEALRRRAPGSLVEIYSLPDPDLALVDPLCALVKPLRLTYWKATIPEIPLRGEGRSEEDAVLDLREKLASSFRLLETEPGSNPQLHALLNRLIQDLKGGRASADAEPGRPPQ